MYMGIQKSLETEMNASQGFYLLSIDIYKMLSLKRQNRDVSGKQYLTDCYNWYQELIKQSKLIHDPSLIDTLQEIPTCPNNISICVDNNVPNIEQPYVPVPINTDVIDNSPNDLDTTIHNDNDNV